MLKLRSQSLVVVTLVGAAAAWAVADDSKQKAVRKDRQRIAGTWRVVELTIDGNRANEEDARKITVVNGNDGTWSARSEGMEISQGTSTIDPTAKPKTIDFTPTEGGGKGDLHLGVYQLGKNQRKLCFAPPGEERPTKFASDAGSGHVLVTLQRIKSP